MLHLSIIEAVTADTCSETPVMGAPSWSAVAQKLSTGTEGLVARAREASPSLSAIPYQRRSPRGDVSPTNAGTWARSKGAANPDSGSETPSILRRELGSDLKGDGLGAPKARESSTRSEARVQAGQPRQQQLAISARVLASRLGPILLERYPDHRAWSVNLGERTGTVAEVKRRALLFADALSESDPSAVGLLVVDRGPLGGHAHLHALILSASSDDDTANLIKRAWLNLWRGSERAVRPLPSLQRVRPIPTGPGRARVMRKVLTHAVDRHSQREAAVRGVAFKLPAFGERFILVGEAMAAILAAARRARPKPTKPHDQRRQNWVTGRCGWCGERVDDSRALWHRNCARRASRARLGVSKRMQPLVAGWLAYLKARAQCFGERPRRDFDVSAFVAHPATDKWWHVFHWLEALEAKGWLRSDALRVIEAAIEGREWPSLHPLLNPRLANVLRCGCGRPLVSRLDGRTCGRGRCRAARRPSPEVSRRRKAIEAGDRVSTQLNSHKTRVKLWSWEPLAEPDSQRSNLNCDRHKTGRA